MGVSIGVALRQRVQQCLRLLQVSGVKPLGEPAVDRGQQLIGFDTLAVVLPEATEAHGGPQLQRFGFLAAGDVQGALQPGFRLRLRCPRLPQEQDATETMNFRFPPAFVMLLYERVGLGQCLEAIFYMAQVGSNVRQQGAQVGDG